MKRFAARRGLPKRFLSDNAKTFKSAAKTMKTICDHPDTQSYLSLSDTEWSFILEKVPWWGGLFERMIKSTMRCLRKFVGRARFSYDEMHTAIVEIEAIINSRPLSYIYSDDLEQPLTPSHLLVGHRLLSLPDYLTSLEPEDDEDFELNTESLQRRAKHLNSVLNHFWKDGVKLPLGVKKHSPSTEFQEVQELPHTWGYSFGSQPRSSPKGTIR